MPQHVSFTLHTKWALENESKYVFVQGSQNKRILGTTDFSNFSSQMSVWMLAFLSEGPGGVCGSPQMQLDGSLACGSWVLRLSSLYAAFPLFRCLHLKQSCVSIFFPDGFPWFTSQNLTKHKFVLLLNPNSFLKKFYHSLLIKCLPLCVWVHLSPSLPRLQGGV